MASYHDCQTSPLAAGEIPHLFSHGLPFSVFFLIDRRSFSVLSLRLCRLLF
jgi:hypothetical protein